MGTIMNTMMNSKTLFIFFAAISILIACSQKNTLIDKQKKTIDVYGCIGNERPISLSEIAEEIEYIPLETSVNSVISNPADIILSNDLIYIKGRLTDPIMVFDKSGKFIRSVDRKGRSSEEYESIVSLDIDNDGIICIESTQKITEYKADGTFIRNIFKNKDAGYRGFAKLNDNFYMFSSALGINMINSYSATDSESNILWNHPFTPDETDILKTHPRAEMFKRPYRFKDKIMIAGGVWDYILSVNDKLEIDTAYFFNYGRFKLTKDNVKDLASTRNIITRQSDILESNRYLFLKYNIGNIAKNNGTTNSAEGVAKHQNLPLMHLYFDKQTGITSSLEPDPSKQWGFIDDFHNGPTIWPVSISDSNHMIAFVPALTFKEAFSGKDTNSKYAQMANSLSDNDNPVVIIVKLKNLSL
ncbi:MAG: 6-bladed beta-propeller [Bacteroidia bacterium]|nr:6-bladed beta-propeller [Bacteroidia bacterium]